MGRLIAVGDIHGCSNVLRVILEGIDPQVDDTFVFLGDYIDRGLDSKGVIDQIIELRKKCNVVTLLGNHEEMLLGAYQGGQSDHNYWCKFGGMEALASYGVNSAREIPGSHLHFIASCNDFYETEDYIFVHAGCDPHIALKDNSGTILRWNKLEEQPEKHFSGKVVVCGHTAQKQILDFGHLICIDTGCGLWYGGKLTAIDLLSGKIWDATIKSKKAKVKQR